MTAPERPFPRQITRFLPHQRERREGTRVDIAVVHAMAEHVRNPDERWGPVGTFDAWNWLDRKTWSAHVLCAPNGDITICVPWDRTAFHAGQSRLGQREWLNDSSLGVEVLVPGTHDYDSFLRTIGIGHWLKGTPLDPLPPDPFTPAQYNALGWLVACWTQEYAGITQERIVGHADVSGPEVRSDPKWDPGPVWDWARFEEARAYWEGWIQAQEAVS